VVPFWQEMAELAKRAAAISPELKTVGWDIALSRNGPVLMEGNDNWDMVIAQVLAGGYLTGERREILREYGMIFP
jgi:glutathione synthase/RimK-type ligase-like ATP-grasp enzyme